MSTRGPTRKPIASVSYNGLKSSVHVPYNIQSAQTIVQNVSHFQRRLQEFVEMGQRSVLFYDRLQQRSKPTSKVMKIRKSFSHQQARSNQNHLSTLNFRSASIKTTDDSLPNKNSGRIILTAAFMQILRTQRQLVTCLNW